MTRITIDQAQLALAIGMKIEAIDEATEEAIAEIVREEIRRFTAALADALEAAGIEDVEIQIKGD